MCTDFFFFHCGCVWTSCPRRLYMLRFARGVFPSISWQIKFNTVEDICRLLAFRIASSERITACQARHLKYQIMTPAVQKAHPACSSINTGQGPRLQVNKFSFQGLWEDSPSAALTHLNSSKFNSRAINPPFLKKL